VVGAVVFGVLMSAIWARFSAARTGGRSSKPRLHRDPRMAKQRKESNGDQSNPDHRSTAPSR
jgi:hypothetical protein